MVIPQISVDTLVLFYQFSKCKKSKNLQCAEIYVHYKIFLVW